MGIADSLAKLRESAGRFNASTDALNDTIAAVDDELAKIGIGLTLWLEDPAAVIWNQRRTYFLGYDKVENGWHIALLPVVPSASGDWVDGGDAMMLLKAPRLLRVEAARHLEPLINALAKRADELVNDVEHAQYVVAAALSVGTAGAAGATGPAGSLFVMPPAGAAGAVAPLPGSNALGIGQQSTALAALEEAAAQTRREARYIGLPRGANPVRKGSK